jgi:hypothetical protein
MNISILDILLILFCLIEIISDYIDVRKGKKLTNEDFKKYITKKQNVTYINAGDMPSYMGREYLRRVKNNVEV